MGNGDGDWSGLGGRDCGEGFDCEHQLTCLFVRRSFRGGRAGKLDLGRGVGVGWRVDDSVVGITNNRLAIVIEFAAIGLVGKEFFKEEGLCSWVIALGTFLAGSIRSSGMRGATAKAATKGSRVLAPVLGIRVRVNGKVIVSRIGLVSLEDGFGWAHKGTNRWRWRWWRRRWWWRRRCVGRGRVGWRGRCTGNEGSSLVAAH